MVLKNSGLSNNTMNESEVTTNTNLEQPGAEEDSDSDLEENDQWGGYTPLAQDPNDSEVLYNVAPESEDEELNLEELGGPRALEESCPSSVPEIKELSATLVEEVWSKSAPIEVDIEMSDKKIDLVKQVMLNIQLPSEAIPTWAKNIPEDEWKNHLLQRLNKNEH